MAVRVLFFHKIYIHIYIYIYIYIYISAFKEVVGCTLNFESWMKPWRVWSFIWKQLSRSSITTYYTGIQIGFNSVVCGWNASKAIQMKASKPYFHAVLLRVHWPFSVRRMVSARHNVVKICEYVNEIPVWDQVMKLSKQTFQLV